ncbi:MAG: transketolase [Clostridia bacterium]|nr:transketolase [Clostridia bacterium]
MDTATHKELEQKAQRLRRLVIKMIGTAGSGHPGGSLSAAEIISVLYFHELRLDPQRPDWPDRDRFILSKGHAAPLLYAALAERGFFPVDELFTLRRLGSRLQGHPDCRRLPGVEMSTGSLGQGLSVGNGLALAARLDGRAYRVYVLLGDGEVQEGMVWEAGMAAAFWRLDNLVAIVDYNGLQIDGPVAAVMSLEPLAEKWRAFGWEVVCIDGHCVAEVCGALAHARSVKGKPTMIVAATVKGKGVSFMENRVEWHGVAPQGEQLAQALEELGDE